MTALPGWLLDHIRANSRNARLHTCPRCRAPIITGLDNDTGAFTVHTDPNPIDQLGETLALLAGRRTFDLEAGRGRLRLTRRTEYDVRYQHHPWGTVVVPEHRCGQPLPTHPHPPTNQRTPIPEEPPF